jgi:hypothetical protein
VAGREVAHRIGKLAKRVAAVDDWHEHPHCLAADRHQVVPTGQSEEGANARAAAAAVPGAPASKLGPVIQRCWREFNARFGIATYTDLNASRFDEAEVFLKAQYKALTGTDLVINEQQGLDLDV